MLVESEISTGEPQTIESTNLAKGNRWEDFENWAREIYS